MKRRCPVGMVPWALAMFLVSSACHPHLRRDAIPEEQSQAEPRHSYAGEASSAQAGQDVDEACNKQLDSSEVEQAIEGLDAAEVEQDMASCRDLVMSKLKLVQVNLVREGSFVDKSRLNVPIGYGLEEVVIAQCLKDRDNLTRHFKQIGICARQEMATVVLTCLRKQLRGSECTPVSDLRAYILSPDRARWIGLSGDELPSGIIIDRHGQGVQSEYQPVVVFLEYLASRNSYYGVYDESRVGHYEPSMISPHLASGGILVRDVNWSSTVRFTQAQITRELLARRGRAFSMLSWIGYRYASKGPQHSQLAFTPSGGRMVVKLDGEQGLRLTFVYSDGAFRLAEIEQMVHADL
jgi:hypothetical protein